MKTTVLEPAHSAILLQEVSNWIYWAKHTWHREVHKVEIYPVEGTEDWVAIILYTELAETQGEG